MQSPGHSGDQSRELSAQLGSTEHLPWALEPRMALRKNNGRRSQYPIPCGFLARIDMQGFRIGQGPFAPCRRQTLGRGVELDLACQVLGRLPGDEGAVEVKAAPGGVRTGFEDQDCRTAAGDLVAHLLEEEGPRLEDILDTVVEMR